MLTIVAFIVALGLLIAVHEWGHYRVAVACGVKVLRFSIGFGPVLYRWEPRRQRPGQATEFVICALPLGGYVRMLDEREAPVPPEERHLAFNNQPLRARAAIVAAGPLANLLLAVALFAAVNWIGTQEPAARLAQPPAASLADEAGLRAGELVARAGAGDELDEVRSFDDLRWQIVRAVLERQDLRLEITGEAGRSPYERILRLSQLDAKLVDAQTLQRIGILMPFARPEIGEVLPQGAAHRAGLRSGDLVRGIDAAEVADVQQLRERIRASVEGGQARTQHWRIERGGQLLDVDVTPDVEIERGLKVGRIGAYLGIPQMQLVRFGPIDGLVRAFDRAWDTSVLTVRMMGRMLIGEASVRNLSGPLTIADYAGKSASMGFVAYLVYLASISLGLGVLNLMPVPVLDGGHLMYYLWEGLTGRRISDAWMERLQRGGAVLLLLMMSIALFNDATRFFG